MPTRYKYIGASALSLSILLLLSSVGMGRPIPNFGYHSRDVLDTRDSAKDLVDFFNNPYEAVLGAPSHMLKSAPMANALPYRLPPRINTGMGIRPPKSGFAHPVEHMRLMRGFDGEACWHQGIDIGGQGELGGVGQAVRSIVKSKIIFIGTPELDAKKFGRRDRRRGYAKRHHFRIPRQIEVPGYPAPIHPMTRTLGSSRTGVFIVTEAMHPQMQKYRVRYLHLAAVKPGLKAGDIVEAGEELGLMGATAIMVSAPHVHIDVETRAGIRFNPAHLLGLDKIYSARCRAINKRAVANWRRRHRRRNRAR